MAEFLPILYKVFDIEKGYQDASNDPGNWTSEAYGCDKRLIGTNHGIGAQTLQEYLKACPTVTQMKTLTKEQAAEIYRQLFWLPIAGDYISDKYLAWNIFDTKVVQAGSFPYIIRDALKRMGVTITVNRTLSSGVIDAINRVNAEQLFYQINEVRKIKFTAAAAAQKRDSVPGSWLARCSNEYGSDGFWGFNGDNGSACDAPNEEELALLEDANPDLMANLKHVDKMKYGWWENNKLFVLIPGALLFLGLAFYGYKKLW